MILTCQEYTWKLSASDQLCKSSRFGWRRQPRGLFATSDWLLAWPPDKTGLCSAMQFVWTSDSRVSQYCPQIMNSQDIPLEDMVLLQLFKDNLLSSGVEESPDMCDHQCPTTLSEVSTASTDSDLSDLDSVLSQQVKQQNSSHSGCSQ